MDFDRPSHDAGAALVLEPIALARDLHDGGVVQEPVEHGSGEHGVAGEGLVPGPKVRFEVRIIGAVLVAARHHLEEEVGLLAAERQVADLVDDQQLLGARCGA